MALLTPAEIDAIDVRSPFDDDLTKLINHIREQDKAMAEARELLTYFERLHFKELYPDRCACIACKRTAAWLRTTSSRQPP
jgi:hypothetical protein